GHAIALPGWTHICLHVPFRRTTAPRPRILRDQRPGMVWWWSYSQGGGLDRRRQALDGRPDQGEGRADGAYPLRLSVELGRERDRSSFALHRRTWPGATNASAGGQVLQRA